MKNSTAALTESIYYILLALQEPKWRPRLGRQIKFDGAVAYLQQLHFTWRSHISYAQHISQIP